MTLEAPHFCASVIVAQRDGEWVVVEAAPILRWTLGKAGGHLREVARRKRWELSVQDDPAQ